MKIDKYNNNNNSNNNNNKNNGRGFSQKREELSLPGSFVKYAM